MFASEMGITIFVGSGSNYCEFTYLSTSHYFKVLVMVFYRGFQFWL
ncbi:hypothetical protein SAMN05661012_02136 [Chitinophaga sancti]|uniref:Uncharacterized protein n=1 Tax=Chitinophaga sancti TaxID=1004 RepID=A0A1K1PRX3_9BACT|nr:hypothetical protein SAMN05661012_02136 [Chitinophaga sancti]